MTSMTTGRFYARTLEGYGVTHVFIVPAIFHAAMAAMEETGIKRVTTHHEVAAAYMADGYARAARRPGVCMGQAVGAANLAAGLHDAFLACSPVIAVAGGASADTRYRYLYQVVEDFAMFEPVTKFNARVEKPERLPDLLRQAFRVATTGAPGPVHLEIPGRLGEGVAGTVETEAMVEEQFARVPAFRPEPDGALVAETARLLSEARRPVIVAGGGVAASDAGAEVAELAEKLGIPVVVTLNGKGAIPDTHPLCVGLMGAYGRRCANELVAEADLVFFIGTRAGSLTSSSWTVPAQGTKVIQLDIDPAEIGRNYPVTVGLAGDAKAALRRLVDVAGGRSTTSEWVARARRLSDGWLAEVAPMMESDAVPIRPERLCRELSEALPENGVLVVDTGHAAIWTGTLLDLKRPGQRFIRCAGTLGWAFPAALGAKCALPDRPVVCFTGDGGMFYHLAELETAARAGINAVIVVNNNGALQQVRKGIDNAYGGRQYGRAHEMWVFRKGTNFARLAEELGCLGIRVESPGELGPALSKALVAQRPVVVDVATDVEVAPPWG